jgi:hypothetical protein
MDQHCRKARRTLEQEAFQIIVVVGDQQHGDGIAIASDHDGAVGPTFVHIGTQAGLYIR